MAPPLLHLRDVELTFGGDPVLKGVELAVSQGERICLVGRNGSGKSTLLKIADGQVEMDDGERFLQPGVTVRYLPQEPDLSAFSTTLDYVEAGLAPGDDAYRAMYLLEQLGLTGNEDTRHLSGGELRRSALARVLAPQPDIILLDEPTNHLDLPAIEWLEKELAQMRSAIVMISHDRRFLEKLSRATVWLDRGKARRMSNSFSEFENWRDAILQQEELDQHKIDRKIVMEDHWLRYGVTARRKRNQKRLAALHDLRKSRREYRQAAGSVAMTVSKGAISGKLVIEAKEISKSFGGHSVVSDFDVRVQRGDRLGIVGPNGAGKTTLIKLLTGKLLPDSGTVKIGSSLEMVTLDQGRSSLNPDWTLKEALTGGEGDTVFVGDNAKHVMSYMKDFLFAPEQAGTPIARLSGGERGRLMLARALARPSNFLVLDEPTNDLDLETLDLLQEQLANYKGTILLVSHDRDFLDRIVTTTVASNGDGRWVEYAGGYSDMLAQRGQASPAGREGRAEPVRSRVPAAPQARPAEKARKLSFKDKFALESLPKRMKELEEAITLHNATLGQSDLFRKDSGLFQKTADALKAAEAELAEVEEHWLKLEMLREEIESR